MQPEIFPVENKKQFRDFINFPWDLYKNDEKWVPQLKVALWDILANKKHPFYETSETHPFVIKEGNKIIARAMAIFNRAHNDFHHCKEVHFGFFECIDDFKTAAVLFEHIKAWARERNATAIVGPFHPSINYESGLLVESDHTPPYLMMPYNLPYYQKLLLDYGFVKEKDLLAFTFDLKRPLPELALKIASRSERSENISYRALNVKKLDDEIDLMLEIYNRAWEKNWGFVPMSPQEFRHTAKDLKSIIDPNLILFASVREEPAGFIVCLPDYNQVFKKIKNGKLLPTGIFKLLYYQSKIDQMRVITLGIKEKFRNLGLAQLLYCKAYQNANFAGYKSTEMSWILEDNHKMIKPLIHLGGEVSKRYRIFKCDL